MKSYRIVALFVFVALLLVAYVKLNNNVKKDRLLPKSVEIEESGVGEIVSGEFANSLTIGESRIEKGPGSMIKLLLDGDVRGAKLVESVGDIFSEWALEDPEFAWNAVDDYDLGSDFEKQIYAKITQSLCRDGKDGVAVELWKGFEVYEVNTMIDRYYQSLSSEGLIAYSSWALSENPAFKDRGNYFSIGLLFDRLARTNPELALERAMKVEDPGLNSVAIRNVIQGVDGIEGLDAALDMTLSVLEDDSVIKKGSADLALSYLARSIENISTLEQITSTIKSPVVRDQVWGNAAMIRGSIDDFGIAREYAKKISDYQEYISIIEKISMRSYGATPEEVLGALQADDRIDDDDRAILVGKLTSAD